MTEQLPFRTERLLLRSVTAADLPRLFALLGDREVMKLALYERPLTRDEAQHFIVSDFAKEPQDITHLGVLCLHENDVVIGFAGLLPCRYFPGDLEFGFVLGLEHHRKGYATEIGRKLIDVGFEVLDCTRLLALCDPQNTASSGVLEKLGMTYINEIPTSDRGRRRVFEITRSMVTHK
ncbi:MAG TPA: GNAT family N-acetyltransferase [Thermoanaerobaculia bacterium]|nr:GNAT family N-acetyltransferase [Thermoanaerobaculia bacterium]